MKQEPICTHTAACLGKSHLGQELVRIIRSLFWLGIRDLSLYPIDRRLQSPQNQGFFIPNCPQAARLFRSLVVFCLR